MYRPMPGMRFDRKHRVIAVAAALQTRGFDVRGVRDGRECRVVNARAQRTSGLQHHSGRPERNLRSRSPLCTESGHLFRGCVSA